VCRESTPGGRDLTRPGRGQRAAVKAAGLPLGTRFHDLRHFYASALIAANLNPKVIQARLGHATIAETMDTYGHLFPDSEDFGRGAVDDVLAGALAEQERNTSALLTQTCRSERGRRASRPVGRVLAGGLTSGALTREAQVRTFL
jgi:hypothetical protein